MAVTVTYSWHHLEGPSRLVRHYTVKGSALIDDIATALFTNVNCPANYGFWQRQWDQKVIRELGGGVWDCDVPYGVGDISLISIPSQPSGSAGGTTGGGRSSGGYTLPGDDVALGPEWSMEFSQSSRLITKSLETLGGYNLTAFGGVPVQVLPVVTGDVIGFDMVSGEVKGVEIPAGAQRIEFSFRTPVVTNGYLKKIRRLSNPPHTNAETFLGWSAGELKFVGGAVNFTYADGFSVRLFMDVGKNQYGVIVSDDLPTVDVKAWDYLDVSYMPHRDTSSPTGWAKKAVQYVVHRVLPEADFNDLFT